VDGVVVVEPDLQQAEEAGGIRQDVTPQVVALEGVKA
jgi:hypothetical protein